MRRHWCPEWYDWCELLVDATAPGGFPEIASAAAAPRSTVHCNRGRLNAAPPLGADVWLCEIDRYASSVERLAQLLSREERERAGRYRVPVVATRYITRQGILRELLASYTDLTANELEFVRGPYGKPHATGSELARHVSFSVSHSNGVALYAVTKRHPVGIDVEYIQPLKDINLILREIFTDREAASLPAHPGTAQTTAFYRLWTRKEAYLKACGIGLGADPAALEMPDMSTTWRIVTLYPRPSYIAALALRNE